MRFVMMLAGLALVALAGLWFFTPVLDQTYARHAPGLAHARSSGAAAPRAGAAQGGVLRQGPSSAQKTTTAVSAIASKNILDNAMSLINAGTGLLGLWFGWMSYRLQVRDSRPKA
jgi:hypothetical protein